ncbi:hypothetical protein OG625_30460 [Streptomyces sp. NBC_01351]|uniref:hypothetical protein n=1 Tax=Streptomyces sp. NBC_01351 TaxID=2903833 RepID=UPI002E350744|nr:hypothetical protein [Streptomyces sp. NBC_01351]
MTETITEPQAPPEESTPAPASPTTAETSTKQVGHTPGGFPVVPLSLTGANATASLLASAALAGGPVAAAVVMTGAVALGAVATRKRGKAAKAKTTTTSKSPSAGAGSSGGRGLLGRVPPQPRTSTRTGGGAGSRKSSGQSRHRASGSAGVGSSGSHRAKGGTSSARQRAVQAAGRLAGGRAGQVRELRASTRAQSPTRAASRTGAVQARRQVADNRRTAKAAERAASAQAKPRGLAARTLAKGMGKAATVRDKAVAGARSIRDRSAGRVVASGRDGIRQAAHRKRVEQLKAPARKVARKALRRSAARFHARRALAGLLGGAAGVLGMVTTPLGRKLRMPSLMHPGRRLYRALVNRARTAREARDAEIRAQLEQDEQAAEAEAAAEQNEDEQHVGDRVERPVSHVPAPPIHEGAPQVSTASGFRFEEYAAEMEAAAQGYEPDNAMEILAMVEGLPHALGSVANVMKILGERSDAEFPLDKAVAETFRDCFGAVMASVSVAEEMGPIFRRVHEQDIARHEDPRNGYDAEKGWNV